MVERRNVAIPLQLKLIRAHRARDIDRQNQFEVDIGHLRSDLLHASFPNLESVLDKVNRYSTAGAQRLHARGRRGSIGRAVASGLWAFVRTYVLQRGFLDGRMGFLLAVSNAEGTYYRYVKLWLLQREDRLRRPHL